MKKPVELIVAGAGNRGHGYSKYALANPEEAKVIGVAEPREFQRNKLVEEHGIPPENVFTDWKDMAAREKFADAVIIATQDQMHTEPAIAFANKKYDMLLEKPMAPTALECRQIVEAAKKNDIIFAVCHVLRYTRYTRALKKLIADGVIGDVVSLQRLEPVGYWHQAHSFVRGNWGNESESTFMLLAKSCHDIDWISHVIDAPCAAVSSFGTLKHFRRECQPEGASDRCVECAVEPECPYSARKIYVERIKAGHKEWPVRIITDDLTEEGVIKAITEGPYGRCVYACDNDVVDNQVVNMLFEDGQTASFTMTAFTEATHRTTSIFGTKGRIIGNGSELRVLDFLTDEETVIDTDSGDGSILGGHGGGDLGLMEAFIPAVANQDPTLILSGPDQTLDSHLMVFAAEEARRKSAVIQP